MSSESTHRTELSDNAPVGPAPTPQRVKTTDAKVADTKVRVQEATTAAREGLATAKTKAAEVGGQVKDAVQKPENAGKMKGGGAATAGATALAIAIWVVRRRRNRPKTLWQKTGQATTNVARATARQASAQGRKAVSAAPKPTRGRAGAAAIVLTTLAGAATYLRRRRSTSNSTY
jgi:hypothetical protein